ncbi:unnamed protein product [Amoebophrya sp. A120]|nr:unnamed protein product [Amoebophrya sp. A120]|eukprot:GSA120T00013911001.1
MSTPPHQIFPPPSSIRHNPPSHAGHQHHHHQQQLVNPMSTISGSCRGHNNSPPPPPQNIIIPPAELIMPVDLPEPTLYFGTIIDCKHQDHHSLQDPNTPPHPQHLQQNNPYVQQNSFANKFQFGKIFCPALEQKYGIKEAKFENITGCEYKLPVHSMVCFQVYKQAVVSPRRNNSHKARGDKSKKRAELKAFGLHLLPVVEKVLRVPAQSTTAGVQVEGNNGEDQVDTAAAESKTTEILHKRFYPFAVVQQIYQFQPELFDHLLQKARPGVKVYNGMNFEELLLGRIDTEGSTAAASAAPTSTSSPTPKINALKEIQVELTKVLFHGARIYVSPDEDLPFLDVGKNKLCGDQIEKTSFYVKFLPYFDQNGNLFAENVEELPDRPAEARKQVVGANPQSMVPRQDERGAGPLHGRSCQEPTSSRNDQLSLPELLLSRGAAGPSTMVNTNSATSKGLHNEKVSTTRPDVGPPQVNPFSSTYPTASSGGPAKTTTESAIREQGDHNHKQQEEDEDQEYNFDDDFEPNLDQLNQPDEFGRYGNENDTTIAHGADIASGYAASSVLGDSSFASSREISPIGVDDACAGRVDEGSSSMPRATEVAGSFPGTTHEDRIPMASGVAQDYDEDEHLLQSGGGAAGGSSSENDNSFHRSAILEKEDNEEDDDLVSNDEFIPMEEQQTEFNNNSAGSMQLGPATSSCTDARRHHHYLQLSGGRGTVTSSMPRASALDHYLPNDRLPVATGLEEPDQPNMLSMHPTHRRHQQQKRRREMRLMHRLDMGSAVVGGARPGGTTATTSCGGGGTTPSTGAFFPTPNNFTVSKSASLRSCSNGSVTPSMIGGAGGPPPVGGDMTRGQVALEDPAGRIRDLHAAPLTRDGIVSQRRPPLHFPPPDSCTTFSSTNSCGSSMTINAGGGPLHANASLPALHDHARSLSPPRAAHQMGTSNSDNFLQQQQHMRNINGGGTVRSLSNCSLRKEHKPAPNSGSRKDHFDNSTKPVWSLFDATSSEAQKKLRNLPVGTSYEKVVKNIQNWDEVGVMGPPPPLTDSVSSRGTTAGSSSARELDQLQQMRRMEQKGRSFTSGYHDLDLYSTSCSMSPYHHKGMKGKGSSWSSMMSWMYDRDHHYAGSGGKGGYYNGYASMYGPSSGGGSGFSSIYGTPTHRMTDHAYNGGPRSSGTTASGKMLRGEHHDLRGGPLHSSYDGNYRLGSPASMNPNLPIGPPTQRRHGGGRAAHGAQKQPLDFDRVLRPPGSCTSAAPPTSTSHNQHANDLPAYSLFDPAKPPPDTKILTRKQREVLFEAQGGGAGGLGSCDRRKAGATAGNLIGPPTMQLSATTQRDHGGAATSVLMNNQRTKSCSSLGQATTTPAVFSSVNQIPMIGGTPLDVPTSTTAGVVQRPPVLHGQTVLGDHETVYSAPSAGGENQNLLVPSLAEQKPRRDSSTTPPPHHLMMQQLGGTGSCESCDPNLSCAAGTTMQGEGQELGRDAVDDVESTSAFPVASSLEEVTGAPPAQPEPCGAGVCVDAQGTNDNVGEVLLDVEMHKDNDEEVPTGTAGRVSAASQKEQDDLDGSCNNDQTTTRSITYNDIAEIVSHRTKGNIHEKSEAIYGHFPPADAVEQEKIQQQQEQQQSSRPPPSATISALPLDQIPDQFQQACSPASSFGVSTPLQTRDIMVQRHNVFPVLPHGAPTDLHQHNHNVLVSPHRQNDNEPLSAVKEVKPQSLPGLQQKAASNLGKVLPIPKKKSSSNHVIMMSTTATTGGHNEAALDPRGGSMYNTMAKNAPQHNHCPEELVLPPPTKRVKLEDSSCRMLSSGMTSNSNSTTRNYYSNAGNNNNSMMMGMGQHNHADICRYDNGRPHGGGFFPAEKVGNKKMMPMPLPPPPMETSMLVNHQLPTPSYILREQPELTLKTTPRGQEGLHLPRGDMIMAATPGGHLPQGVDQQPLEVDVNLNLHFSQGTTPMATTTTRDAVSAPAPVVQADLAKYAGAEITIPGVGGVAAAAGAAHAATVLSISEMTHRPITAEQSQESTAQHTDAFQSNSCSEDAGQFFSSKRGSSKSTNEVQFLGGHGAISTAAATGGLPAEAMEDVNNQSHHVDNQMVEQAATPHADSDPAAAAATQILPADVQHHLPGKKQHRNLRRLDEAVKEIKITDQQQNYNACKILNLEGTTADPDAVDETTTTSVVNNTNMNNIKATTCLKNRKSDDQTKSTCNRTSGGSSGKSNRGVPILPKSFGGDSGINNHGAGGTGPSSKHKISGKNERGARSRSSHQQSGRSCSDRGGGATTRGMGRR